MACSLQLAAVPQCLGAQMRPHPLNLQNLDHSTPFRDLPYYTVHTRFFKGSRVWARAATNCAPPGWLPVSESEPICEPPVRQCHDLSKSHLVPSRHIVPAGASGANTLLQPRLGRLRRGRGNRVTHCWHIRVRVEAERLRTAGTGQEERISTAGGALFRSVSVRSQL